MADNRDNSQDSRVFGPIQESDVVGGRSCASGRSTTPAGSGGTADPAAVRLLPMFPTAPALFEDRLRDAGFGRVAGVDERAAAPSPARWSPPR